MGAPRRAEVIGIPRKCTRCGQHKSIENFPLRLRGQARIPYYSRHSQCKECISARKAELRVPKKDSINARIRERRASNPIKTKKQKEKWYATMKAKEKLSSGFITCTKCKIEKPTSEFYKRCVSATGFQYRCKFCAKDWWRSKYYGDVEFRKKALDDATIRNRKAKYGVKPEVFNAILQAQDNKCAICNTVLDGSKFSLKGQLDHCHATGTVRGILCGKCNTSLGGFRDSEHILLAAARYVTRYRSG